MKHAASAQETFPPMDNSSKPPAPASFEISDDSEPTISLWQRLRAWLRSIVSYRPGISLKEIIEEAIEEHQEQSEEQLPIEEKRMLHNVLSFSDIKVSEIMTPRTDITAVPHDIMLITLKGHILRHRHTRIPVYKDTLYQMQGFIHVKDLLPMLSGDIGFELKALLRDLLFVPPSMRGIDLLVKMQRSSIHMAIVVDEHGGTDGLVTLEDVFEEIVGDIQDEHDSKDDDQFIARVSDRAFEVNARIRIETLEQQIGLNLVTEEKAGEFDTLGGLIFFQLGRVPVKGDIVRHTSGIRFEILEADARRIHTIRIHTN
jgi:magnesium and cobalt transporter